MAWFQVKDVVAKTIIVLLIAGFILWDHYPLEIAILLLAWLLYWCSCEREDERVCTEDEQKKREAHTR